MKKGQLKALFIEAKGTGQKYIGVMIQTEGSSEPEVIINPKENFNAKFDYYMAAYDDDLILIAAKGKKDIRITGAAAGASFEDIQSQLIDEKASSGWKEQIANAVDRVVDKMLKETPPETEEERQNCARVIKDNHLYHYHFSPGRLSKFSRKKQPKDVGHSAKRRRASRVKM